MNERAMHVNHLLCRKVENSLLRLQKELEETIRKERYEWKTFRIGLEGIRWEIGETTRIKKSS